MENKELTLQVCPETYDYLSRVSKQLNLSIDHLASRCTELGLTRMDAYLNLLGIVDRNEFPCPNWFPKIPRDDSADLFHKCSVSFSLPEAHYLTLVGIAGDCEQTIDEYVRDRIALLASDAAVFGVPSHWEVSSDG